MEEARCGRRAHFTSQQASSSPLQVGIWKRPGGALPNPSWLRGGSEWSARVPEIETILKKQPPPPPKKKKKTNKQTKKNTGTGSGEISKKESQQKRHPLSCQTTKQPSVEII